MLPWVDAVVLSAPLFVNAAPSHVVTFLEKGEHQNEMHLRIYEGWCQRAGISWGADLPFSAARCCERRTKRHTASQAVSKVNHFFSQPIFLFAY